MYHGKGDKSFIEWIIKVEMIARFTQHLTIIQLAQAKDEGTAHKLADGMPQSSKWDAVKKRLCQVFSPVATQMHVATKNHSTPESASETLQKYIHQFIDLVTLATGQDPTSITCQVIIVSFIRQCFNKEIKKQVTETKNIQTLKHTMTLAEEARLSRKVWRSK